MSKIQPSQWRTIINPICTLLTTLLAGLTMSSCSSSTGVSMSSLDFVTFGVINLGIINWGMIVLVIVSIMMWIPQLKRSDCSQARQAKARF